MQVFEERGKPECPGENLSEQRREPRKFNSRMTPSRTTSNIEPGPNWWEATALTTTPRCGQGSCSMWVECVGPLLCSERFIAGYSCFPLSKETKI